MAKNRFTSQPPEQDRVRLLLVALESNDWTFNKPQPLNGKSEVKKKTMPDKFRA